VFLLFLQVFDGHGGIDAASFIRKNILNYIVEDSHFPSGIRKAVKSAFVKADHAFADAASLDSSSGTTALTTLITGRLGTVLLHIYLSLLHVKLVLMS
jgi:protein phosphatase 2C family protein 2/3